MRAFHGPKRGNPTIPTVICLHASGSSGGQWKALTQRLQDDFHVLTPDLYGHGAGPAWHYAPGGIVAADAGRIAQLVAETTGDVHLVGHSYGGAIALRVALNHPESVVSVAVYEPVTLRILFDHNPKHRAAAEVAEVAGNMRRALSSGNFEHAAQYFVDYWSGADHWPQLAPEQRAAIAHRMPVIYEHFRSLVSDVVRLPDYMRLDVPVLYLAGRETRASARQMSELLESALPDFESFTFDAMAHLGPITHAETVAERIAHFVRRQATARIVDERKAA